MKVVIFGAYCEIAERLSTILMEKGHEVHSCANINGMEKVLKGADVVVSLIIPEFRADNVAASNQVKYIISAMQKAHVNRLIQISHTIIEDQNDKFNLIFWIFNNIVKLLFKGFYEETNNISQEIKNSQLDWSLVRIGLLRDKPETISTKISYLGRGSGVCISGHNLANFLARESEQNYFVKRAICVSTK